MRIKRRMDKKILSKLKKNCIIYILVLVEILQLSAITTPAVLPHNNNYL